MSTESLVTGDKRPGELDGPYDKRPVLVKRLLYQKRKGSVTHFLFSADILLLENAYPYGFMRYGLL